MPGPGRKSLSSIGLTRAAGGPANLFMVRQRRARLDPAMDPAHRTRRHRGAGRRERSRGGARHSSRRVSTSWCAASWISARPSCLSSGRTSLEIPVFDLPKDATVLADERWDHAPVMAGVRRGSGAVLWIAARPARKATNASRTCCKRSTIWASSLRSAASGCGPSSTASYRSRVDLGLLRRALAQGRDRRAARGRLALLRIDARSPTRICAASSKPAIARRFWSMPGWSCRTSARNSGTIIRSGAKKRRILAGRAAGLAQAHEPDQSRVLRRRFRRA